MNPHYESCTSMRRGRSAPAMHVPATPNQPLKPSLLRSRSCSDTFLNSSNSSSTISPTTVMGAIGGQQQQHAESCFYAPSRQKRVTFASEVTQKAAPVRQRLHAMSLEDLDHGIYVPRAAFKSDDQPEDLPKLKCRRNKPIATLTRRLEKVKRQLEADSFEVEVAQNDVEELLEENEILWSLKERCEMEQMGYETLKTSVYELKSKSRKYSSKIKVLRKAVGFFNDESAALVLQLQESKKQVRRSSKERRIEALLSVH
eukprot:CAMPEP_0119016196 /NCGR_PEP_ID=MMETSP1176-20130426/11866_1 /TAXON_ID=265551 /ORGANISM="Synedropsis recta cf, Strain CCMP1620" /LENGTH=257 /DNA_ID=CAMNT_0006969533 /DNA_START=49 /DNA_END=822 /DNA_ORIENTATION=+